MCCLIENVLPIDYYTSMLGVLYDSRIFYDLLYYHNERIYEKFKDLEFEPSVLVIQWFICLYVNTLKNNVSLGTNLSIPGPGTFLFFSAFLAQQQQQHASRERECITAKNFAYQLPGR